MLFGSVNLAVAHDRALLKAPLYSNAWSGQTPLLGGTRACLSALSERALSTAAVVDSFAWAGAQNLGRNL